MNLRFFIDRPVAVAHGFRTVSRPGVGGDAGSRTEGDAEVDRVKNAGPAGSLTAHAAAETTEVAGHAHTAAVVADAQQHHGSGLADAACVPVQEAEARLFRRLVHGRRQPLQVLSVQYGRLHKILALGLGRRSGRRRHGLRRAQQVVPLRLSGLHDHKNPPF